MTAKKKSAKVSGRSWSRELASIVLLMTNGVVESQVKDWCAKQGMTDEESASCIRMAREQVSVESKYERSEQVGQSIMRLRQIYSKSVSESDWRTALQAQKELNKLMGLYGDSAVEDVGNVSEQLAEVQRRLDLISDYILPLKLCDDSYPIEEHVRVASQKLIQQKT